MKIEIPDWCDGRHTLNVITAINLLIDSNNEHEEAIAKLTAPTEERPYYGEIGECESCKFENEVCDRCHYEAVSTKPTMKDLPPEVTDAVNDNINELIDSEPDTPDINIADLVRIAELKAENKAIAEQLERHKKVETYLRKWAGDMAANHPVWVWTKLNRCISMLTPKEGE